MKIFAYEWKYILLYFDRIEQINVKKGKNCFQDSGWKLPIAANYYRLSGNLYVFVHVHILIRDTVHIRVIEIIFFSWNILCEPAITFVHHAIEPRWTIDATPSTLSTSIRKYRTFLCVDMECCLLFIDFCMFSTCLLNLTQLNGYGHAKESAKNTNRNEFEHYTHFFLG